MESERIFDQNDVNILWKISMKLLELFSVKNIIVIKMENPGNKTHFSSEIL